MQLDGKVAIVTGAARGIGRGIALALARHGVHVAVADLFQPSTGTAGYALSTEAQVQATVSEIISLGPRSIGVPVDVTRWKLVQTMRQKVEAELGPVDILCNNAGVIDSAPVVKTTESQWDAMMDVNVKGVFLCCKAVIPGMSERRRGRIVNIASTAGKQGSPPAGRLLRIEVCGARLHPISGVGAGCEPRHRQRGVSGHTRDQHVARPHHGRAHRVARRAARVGI